MLVKLEGATVMQKYLISSLRMADKSSVRLPSMIAISQMSALSLVRMMAYDPTSPYQWLLWTSSSYVVVIQEKPQFDKAK